MKRNQSYKIVHSYFGRLKKNTSLLQKKIDEEAIHQFRADIKKLRAFLRMMRLVTEKPDDLKFPHKFKKMYALTGKIRDRQLQLKILNKKHAPEQIATLRKEINDLEKKTTVFLSGNDTDKIEKNILKVIPAKYDETLIRKFLLQKRDNIRQLVAGEKLNDKALHEIRKNIKDIIYITRIFREEFKTSLIFPFAGKAALKQAEDLAHLLGLFNDASISLASISPGKINKTGKGEKEQLGLLRKTLKNEKQKLKKQILSRITTI